MSIAKRSEIYYARFTAPSGQRIFRSCKTSDKAKAQEFHDRLKAKYWDIQVAGHKQQYTYDQAAERYLMDHMHIKDINNLIWHLELLQVNFGGILLNDFSRDLIDKFTVKRKKDKTRTGKLLSNSRVNKSLEVLRAVLRFARDDMEWVGSIPKVKMLPVDSERVRWITRTEADLLIKLAPLHLKPMIEFALQTGLRESNVTGLKWQNIDLVRKTAWVHASESKNAKAIGIPLNKKAIYVIRQQIGHHDTNVFTYRNKSVKKASTKAFRNAVKKAGIDDFHWHDLRHTWASWHVMNDTPLHVLQKLGGWSSYEMVLRYAHLSTSHLQKYTEAIDIDLKSAENTLRSIK